MSRTKLRKWERRMLEMCWNVKEGRQMVNVYPSSGERVGG